MIIEDDVLVGGNCGVYEGTVVKRRAVLGTGTILNRSIPVYDLVDAIYTATDTRAADHSRKKPSSFRVRALSRTRWAKSGACRCRPPSS